MFKGKIPDFWQRLSWSEIKRRWSGLLGRFWARLTLLKQRVWSKKEFGVKGSKKPQKVSRHQKRQQKKFLEIGRRPATFWRRFFWRLHPKRLFRYWFSWRGLLTIFLLILLGLLVLLVASYFFYKHYSRDLPKDINNLQSCLQGETTRYYDRSGQILLWSSKSDVDCLPIKGIDEVSQNLIDALLVSEDQNFYKHNGFDQGSILRAAWSNFRGEDLQGGSTITQQYVKNAVLKDSRRNFDRKIRELILAIELERKFAKDEILTAYLNTISFGSIYDGIKAASYGYFKKSPKDLTLDEASLLTAALPAPSFYWANPERHLARQRAILNQMLLVGKITPERYQATLEIDVLAKVRRQKNQYESIKAPHFILEVEKQLRQKHGYGDNIRQLGLQVITTLDIKTQELAEESVAEILPDLEDRGFDNAGAVAVEVASGKVLAEVGSRDFFYPEFGQINVTTTPYDPGSVFKLFSYASLIEQTEDWGAGSTFYDYETAFTKPLGDQEAWTPPNYNKKHAGPISLRESFGRSLNIPAIKAMYIVGIDKVFEFANQAGIKTPPQCGADYCGLSSAIGGGVGIRLDEATNSYATFARGGVYRPLTYIDEIRDQSGRLIHKWHQSGERVVSSQTAYIINDILSDESVRYTQRFNLDGIVAGVKTGTTNYFKSNLIIGYSRQVAFGAWMGHHDISRTFGESQTTTPKSKILKTFMNGYHQDILGQTKTPGWSAPSGIKTHRVNKQTGYVVDPDELVGAIAALENSPKDIYPDWYQAKSNPKQVIVVDKVSGFLATECTPPAAQEILFGANFRPEIEPDDPFYEEWLTPIREDLGSNQIADAPTAYDNFHDCDDQLAEVTVATPDVCYQSCQFEVLVNPGRHFLKKIELLTDKDQLIEEQSGQQAVGLVDGQQRFWFDYQPETNDDDLRLKVLLTDEGLYQVSHNFGLTTIVDSDDLWLQPVLVDRLKKSARISWRPAQEGLSLNFYQACKDQESLTIEPDSQQVVLDIKDFNPGFCRVVLMAQSGQSSNSQDFFVDELGSTDQFEQPPDPDEEASLPATPSIP